MIWKPLFSPMFVPPNYTAMEATEDGRIWIGKFRKGDIIYLRAGYLNRPDEIRMDIHCGGDLRLYEQLLEKLKDIINASPEEIDIFLKFLPTSVIFPYNLDKRYMSRLQKSHQKAMEQTKPLPVLQRKVVRKPLKLHQNGTTSETDKLEQLVPAPAAPILPISQAPQQEEEPEEKDLPMDQDAFLSMLAGLDTGISSLVGRQEQVDYDFRIIVVNPTSDGKVTSKSCKITFGKYFISNQCLFTFLVTSPTTIAGKKEQVLIFDSGYFASHEDRVDIKYPKKFEEAGKKIMSTPFNNTALAMKILRDIDSPENKALNAVTTYKWDVFPIKIKDVEEKPKNFILRNFRRTVSGLSNEQAANIANK